MDNFILPKEKTTRKCPVCFRKVKGKKICCKQIKCSFCGQKGLIERKTKKGKIILINQSGNEHKCLKPKCEVSCQYCKEENLFWKRSNEDKWILVQKNNREHDCQYVAPIIRRIKNQEN